MPLASHIIGNATIVTGEWDIAHKPALREYLTSEQLAQLIEKIGQHVIIVLGGDGVMLEAIDAYRGHDIPFLGINFGTVGYLMHKKETLIHAQKFEKTNHPLLKVHIDADGKKSDHYAVGDMYIKPQVGGRTCIYSTEIHLPQGPKVSISSVLGDGCIVSTAAGSTGYAGNCGASTLPLESNQFLVTHIAPPRVRALHPSQIPNESTVIITPQELNRRPIHIYTDGRIIHSSGTTQNLCITIKKATKSIQLLVADTHRDAWYTRSYRDDGYELIS